MNLSQQLKAIVTKSINTNDPRPFIALERNTYNRMLDHIIHEAHGLYDGFKQDVSQQDRFKQISIKANEMYLEYLDEYDLLNREL